MTATMNSALRKLFENDIERYRIAGKNADDDARCACLFATTGLREAIEFLNRVEIDDVPSELRLVTIAE